MSSYKEAINKLSVELSTIKYDLVLPDKLFLARIQSAGAISEMLDKIRDSNSPDEVKQFWYTQINTVWKVHDLFEEVGDELRLLTGANNYYSDENKALIARVKELEIENNRLKEQWLGVTK